MTRSRKLRAAGTLAMLGLCLVAVYRVRPVPYIYSAATLMGGVPEMQVAPILACPPVLVQSVQRQSRSPPPSLQRVYVITPTYPRAVQVPEMTRLAQTLMLTSNVFWVVTEDAAQPTPAVTEILQRSGLPHVHILGLKPEKYSRKAGFKGAVPRGVSNRMAAIEWLRQNANDGVFYFADDDNTYDYRLFEELARTVRVSAFPVGLVTQTGVSTPIVQDGAVTSFYDGWIGGRTFPMDMAGFAVSVQLLLQHPKAAMPFTAGYEEDGFLKSLSLKKQDLEPLADNCTKILVWHTQTKQPKVPFTTIDPEKYRNTNIEILRHVVHPSPFPWILSWPVSSPVHPGPFAAPTANNQQPNSGNATANNQHPTSGNTTVKNQHPVSGNATANNQQSTSGNATVKNRHRTSGNATVKNQHPTSGSATVKNQHPTSGNAIVLPRPGPSGKRRAVPPVTHRLQVPSPLPRPNTAGRSRVRSAPSHRIPSPRRPAPRPLSVPPAAPRPPSVPPVARRLASPPAVGRPSRPASSGRRADGAGAVTRRATRSDSHAASPVHPRPTAGGNRTEPRAAASEGRAVGTGAGTTPRPPPARRGTRTASAARHTAALPRRPPPATRDQAAGRSRDVTRALLSGDVRPPGQTAGGRRAGTGPRAAGRSAGTIHTATQRPELRTSLTAGDRSVTRAVSILSPGTEPPSAADPAGED